MRILAAVLLVTAAAPAYAEVHVVVHGAIERESLRAQIANELDDTVTISDDACVEPCLQVSVDGTSATVVFAPRDGAPRTRTVELGDNPAHWPDLVTWLAGNLVRDEAAGVLADLPDAPAAAPEAPADIQLPEPPLEVAPVAPPAVSIRPAAIAPAPEVEASAWTLVGIGLVPGLSTDFLRIGEVRHFLSASAIVQVSAGSSGIAVSGIADIEDGRVSGFQGAGITTIAGHVSGVQAAGIAAIADDLEGVQLGGIATIADHVDGIQLAGIAAIADRADHQVAGIAAISDGGAGWQLAGIGTVAGSADLQIAGIGAFADHNAMFQFAGIAAVADTASVQAAGIASIADHGRFQIAGIASVADDGNVQLAGLANVADHANLQVAGLVNVADSVRGVQIAPINIAGSGSGTQIGVINIGGSKDAFSFGLINIVPGGRYDLEATVDSSRVGTLLFRHGGVGWHNVYGIGGQNVDEHGPNNDIWMYGLGFGPSWRLHNTRVDLEAIAWEVNHGARHETDVSMLAQLRLSFAFGLGPFALVAGGAINTYISDDMQSPIFAERRTTMPTSNAITTETWPSAFVGIRL